MFIFEGGRQELPPFKKIACLYYYFASKIISLFVLHGLFPDQTMSEGKYDKMILFFYFLTELKTNKIKALLNLTKRCFFVITAPSRFIFTYLV